MMSKADSNEQFDADILRSKADFPRVHDITSAHKKTTPQEPKSQNSSESTTPLTYTAPISAKKEEIDSPCGQKFKLKEIKPSGDIGSKVNLKETDPAGVHQGKGKIPKFDLAEDIMAEQRKVTAIRRKAPSRKNEAQSQEPVGPNICTTEQPALILSEQDKIIAEIVVRDIERLCRGV